MNSTRMALVGSLSILSMMAGRAAYAQTGATERASSVPDLGDSETGSDITRSRVLAISSVTLLDLGDGIESGNSGYRVSPWPKNAIGKYDPGNTFLGFDTIVRFPAYPQLQPEPALPVRLRG